MTNGRLKWCNGYQAHRYLIIDDFRSYHQRGNDILRILDRYPYFVKIKGSTRQMLAEDIIITSCSDPITVFEREEDKNDKELKQILRRIDKIYLVEDGGKWIEKTETIKKKLDNRQMTE